MSANAGWYYLKGSVQQGPVSWEELVTGARSGLVAPADPVWTSGMSGWVPAATVPGLHSATGVAPAYGGDKYADDPVMRMILPVGRSGWAIAAGYLGLFAFLVLPAPLALAAGLIALADMKKHPEKHGKGRAIFGITIGALGTALLLFVLVYSPN